MVKRKEIEKLKNAALFETESIENEFNEIIKKTQKKKKSIFVDIFEDYELKQLYLERKDKKYAALTIELYATIEQLLKKLHSLYYPQENYRNVSNENVILNLEKKLEKLSFINNTKLIADLRKFIVHDEFSLKEARKKHAKDFKNNKSLFEKLLSDVNFYINSIKKK